MPILLKLAPLRAIFVVIAGPKMGPGEPKSAPKLENGTQKPSFLDPAPVTTQEITMNMTIF